MVVRWDRMPNRYGWMSDTDSKAFQALVEMQRRMTPGEKLARVFELSEMLMRMSEANVRKLHPAADDREVFLRAAARRLGKDTVKRVYGWSPEDSEDG